MKNDFVEYLPYIIVTLLIVSGIAIYERGGFEKEKAVPTPSPEVSQTLPPTPSPTPLSTPTALPIPVKTLAPALVPSPIGTIPSIQRHGGGDD